MRMGVDLETRCAESVLEVTSLIRKKIEKGKESKEKRLLLL